MNQTLPSGLTNMSEQSQGSVEAEGETTTAEEPLRQEIAGGLLCSHHRVNANTTKTLEMTAVAHALIELLLKKELLTEEELNEHKRVVGQRLVEKFNQAGMAVVIHDSQGDKYEFEDDPKIDCESPIHLCEAACCRLRFSLSRQDLEEGIVKRDLPHPYLIAHGVHGYCRHLGRGSCRCTVYQHRPLPCRAYDCRQDHRIWTDFENRVDSPELGRLFQT